MKYIYGISYKNNIHGLDSELYVFTSEEAANKWLNKDQRQFRRRGFCDKPEAVKICVVKSVDTHKRIARVFVDECKGCK